MSMKMKRSARAALALFSVLAVVLPATVTEASMGGSGAAGVVNGPAAATARSPRAADGPFAVGVTTRTFVDTSRPTPANGTAPAKPDRTLVTTILYPAKGTPSASNITDAPAARGSFPLIAFAHGFTASGPAYTLLLRQFAAAGYVVAAPTFPLSSSGAPGGPTITDYVNQPGDVSFVIGEVLRLNHERSSGLAHLIRPRHIAVAGHSLGAITTLGLLNTCCIDKRIDAVVPISGIELPFPGGSFTFMRRTPILLIHGDADHTVPYGGSQQVFAAARPPKFFLTLIGGPHTPFFGPAGPIIVRSMTDFFDRYLKRRRSALDRLFIDGQVPGIASLQYTVR